MHRNFWSNSSNLTTDFQRPLLVIKVISPLVLFDNLKCFSSLLLPRYSFIAILSQICVSFTKGSSDTPARNHGCSRPHLARQPLVCHQQLYQQITSANYCRPIVSDDGHNSLSLPHSCESILSQGDNWLERGLCWEFPTSNYRIPCLLCSYSTLSHTANLDCSPSFFSELVQDSHQINFGFVGYFCLKCFQLSLECLSKV